MHVLWFTDVDETLRAGPLQGRAELGHARAQARPSPVEPETQVTLVAAPEVTGGRAGERAPVLGARPARASACEGGQGLRTRCH